MDLHLYAEPKKGKEEATDYDQTTYKIVVTVEKNTDDSCLVGNDVVTKKNYKITGAKILVGDEASTTSSFVAGDESHAATINIGNNDDTTTAVRETSFTNRDYEMVEIKATKKWVDHDNADGKRPDKVELKLYADGKDTGKKLALTADDNWEGSFKLVRKYKLDDNGQKQEIKYTLKESSDGSPYTASYSDTDMTVTNTYEAKTSLTVKTIWKDHNNAEGKRLSSLILMLYKRGSDTAVKTVTLDGTADITDYYVKQTSASDLYDTTYEKEDYALDGHSITNSYDVKAAVVVNKQWNDDDDKKGVRPDSVTFTLYANGEKDKTITLDGETDDDGEKAAWQASFEDLDKYDDEDQVIDLYSQRDIKRRALYDKLRERR